MRFHPNAKTDPFSKEVVRPLYCLFLSQDLSRSDGSWALHDRKKVDEFAWIQDSQILEQTIFNIFLFSFAPKLFLKRSISKK